MRTVSPPSIRQSLPAKQPGKTLQDFERIFLQSTIAILITDQKGHIAAVNAAALQELGYKESELAGKHVEVLVPPRLRTTHKAQLRYYMSKPLNRLMGCETMAYSKSRKEIPVEIHLSNYRLGDAIYVIVFISTIPAHIQSERKIGNVMTELKQKVQTHARQLQASMRQLEKTNEKFERIRYWQEAIVSNAGSIMIATDTDGIIQLFNPEAEHATGFLASEMIGKVTPFELHDRTEMEQLKRELKMKHGITVDNDSDMALEMSKQKLHRGLECSLLKKDGTKFPVLLTMTTIRDSRKNTIGYLGVAIDISDRKKAEEELRRSFEKEKELGEMKTRFISMASHEFRTPLSTVLSSAYLIERYVRTEEQPQREVHLSRIISAVTMLTGILNDFMSAGRIEEGKIQVRCAQMKINDWMLLTMREMEGMLKKGQHFIYHHEGEALLETDASLFKQILVNLVSNATKFSEPDTSIHIRTKQAGTVFSLAVKDHGIGISAEDQRHLKERFFRSMAVEHIQGTGLGLHIVSRYAELLGGKLYCRSVPGKGTTFTVKFTTGTKAPR